VSESRAATVPQRIMWIGEASGLLALYNLSVVGRGESAARDQRRRVTRARAPLLLRLAVAQMSIVFGLTSIRLV
jgi:hypothetical protein